MIVFWLEVIAGVFMIVVLQFYCMRASGGSPLFSVLRPPLPGGVAPPLDNRAASCGSQPPVLDAERGWVRHGVRAIPCESLA